MKKGMLIIFTILGVLMASSVLAGPLESLGNTFSSLFGSIGSLSFLGGTSDQFLGFIRILYAILVFTVFFFFGSFFGDKVPKNILVPIAIIVAIFASILTPSTLIMAIATGYSTAVAFVLLGILIGGGIYFVLKDRTHSMGALISKIIAILIAFWVLGQFTAFLSGRGLYTAIPAAAELGDWGSIVDTFSEWAYLAFAALLIWVLVDFFGFRDKDSDNTWGSDSEGKRNWLGKLFGSGKESSGDEPAGTEAPEAKAEEEKLEKRLARVLRRVYRYNKRALKQIKDAHKESLKSQTMVDMKKIKKELMKAIKLEKKEIDFNALSNDLVGKIEEISKSNPELKNKLDILNKLLKKELANLKDKLPKAAKLVDDSKFTQIPAVLVSAKNSCEKIKEEILGLEAVAKGLKKEL